MKKSKKIPYNSSLLKKHNVSILEDMSTPNVNLIFLIGNTNSGKTQLLKEYLKVRNNTINVIALGADSRSSIHLNADNMFSFFELPLGSVPNGFYSLLDYRNIAAVDEIIIDGFDFDRVDIFFGIIRSIQLSLHRGRSNNALSNLRVIISGRPMSKVSNDSIFEFYKNSSFSDEVYWPMPHIINLDKSSSLHKVEVEDYIRRKYKTLESLYKNVEVISDPGNDSVIISNSSQRVMEHNMRGMDSLIGNMNIRTGKVKGKFDLHMPVPLVFHCKIGMKVLFTETIHNKKGELLFSRGDVGKIVAGSGILSKLFNSPFHLTDKSVSILLSNGKVIKVRQYKWDSVKYNISSNKISGSPEYAQVVVGSYYQYPLVTAYSLEVDTARGLIFDHVHLDFTNTDRLINFLNDWRSPLTVTISHRLNELLKKHFTKDKQTAA